MGRGRAKAKQTKVARELKYRNHGTDLDALARELHGGEDSVEPEVVEEEEVPDRWSDYDPPSSR